VAFSTSTAIASASLRDSRSSGLALENSNVAMVGVATTVETIARIARTLNIYPVPIPEGLSRYRDDPASERLNLKISNGAIYWTLVVRSVVKAAL
jgi:hypothetical protein